MYARHAMLPLLFVLGAGCGGVTTVRGNVLAPAEVPVRSFPRIWVGSGHMLAESRLADALTRHLRRGGDAEVRRVDVEDLEPLRAASRIPQATVVVILALEMQEQSRPEWGTRPETVCGPTGCYTSYRSYAYDVPTLDARLSVTVYDGPTARVQQRLVVSQQDSGRTYESMRVRVVGRLIRRLVRMVDQRRVSVEVDLLDVDRPGVQRAIGHIERGDWTAGRRALEGLIGSAGFGALSVAQRARLLYDLGQARRFDPETLGRPARHFRAARQALSAALRLDPQPRYDRALRDLERHRLQFRVVSGQRAAAEHNFRLGTSAPGVPEPPSSYRSAPRRSNAPTGSPPGPGTP